MTTAENPRAVMGGNTPPDPLIIEANERIDTANKWLIERPLITDMETADKANFFVSQIGATWTALDNQRKNENRDWLAAQDKKYRSPLELLAMAKGKLTDKRRDFLRREEDRLAAEKAKIEAEARRKADEAAAALAKAEAEAKKKGGDALRTELAAKEAVQAAADAVAAVEAAPVKASITGTYSARATGLKDAWSAEITDLSEAFKHYNKKSHPSRSILAAAIEAAILTIANRDAKFLKDETMAPPGIKFVKERK